MEEYLTARLSIDTLHGTG